MDMSSAAAPGGPYQLRFAPLSGARKARFFRCDAAGRVDLDSLDDRERLDYLFARALIGRDFGRPAVHRAVDEPLHAGSTR